MKHIKGWSIMSLVVIILGVLGDAAFFIMLAMGRDVSRWKLTAIIGAIMIAYGVWDLLTEAKKARSVTAERAEDEGSPNTSDKAEN